MSLELLSRRANINLQRDLIIPSPPEGWARAEYLQSDNSEAYFNMADAYSSTKNTQIYLKFDSTYCESFSGQLMGNGGTYYQKCNCFSVILNRNYRRIKYYIGGSYINSTVDITTGTHELFFNRNSVYIDNEYVGTINIEGLEEWDEPPMIGIFSDWPNNHQLSPVGIRINEYRIYENDVLKYLYLPVVNIDENSEDYGLGSMWDVLNNYIVPKDVMFSGISPGPEII